jgi:catalase
MSTSNPRNPRNQDQKAAATRNSRATASGPADPRGSSRAADDLVAKAAGTQELAARVTHNPIKPSEYATGDEAVNAPAGRAEQPADPIVGSSTVTEMNGSEKVGSGGPPIGTNKTIAPLDRVRVDSTGQGLTTNRGVPVADNQNSLKAGLRGPTLLEDFILREKITHFDHERIPERIVHARGSAAQGTSSAMRRSRSSREPVCSLKPASRHRCSSVSPPSSVSVARPIRPATSEALR